MAEAPSAAAASTTKGSPRAAPCSAAVTPVTAKSTEPVTTAVLISVELLKASVSTARPGGKKRS
jgi:hypothetical protein